MSTSRIQTPSGHPNSEELKVLLDGPAAPDSRAVKSRVVRYLLTEPTDCSSLFEEAGWSRTKVDRLLLLPLKESDGAPVGTDYDYGPAFQRAEKALAARIHHTVANALPALRALRIVRETIASLILMIRTSRPV